MYHEDSITDRNKGLKDIAQLKLAIQLNWSMPSSEQDVGFGN
jgi:hypothetical protein